MHFDGLAAVDVNDPVLVFMYEPQASPLADPVGAAVIV
jgi:hypothetical protein